MANDEPFPFKWQSRSQVSPVPWSHSEAHGNEAREYMHTTGFHLEGVWGDG